MRDHPVLVLAALVPLALASAAIVRIMIRGGVLDVPGARSSHDRPVPKGGGVGIVAAFLAGFAMFAAAGNGAGATASATLLAATGFIAAIAWIDDLRPFGFAPKLAAQCAAGLLLLWGGWRFALPPPVPPWLADVATLGWILFATNAVNFIDGLNGLASGSALIVAAVLGATSLRSGNEPLAALALPLAAGLAGFLPFNFPRARIFMSDVGSQACGLLLAGAATRTGPGIAGAIAVPLALIAILADVGITLLRRLIAGDRLTDAHRGHLYQLARRAGLPAPMVTTVYWSLTALGSLSFILPDRRPAIVAATVAAFAVWSVAALRAARRSPIGKW